MNEKYLEEIKNKKDLIAVIIRSGYQKDGIEFFTPVDFSQQLAYMNSPTGYRILPHVHNIIQREVFYTQEVLFVKKGKVKVDFYDDTGNYLDTRVIGAGDVIFLAMGGHGLEMLEQTEIIEVKQGPYSGEKDKTHFYLQDE